MAITLVVCSFGQARACCTSGTIGNSHLIATLTDKGAMMSAQLVAGRMGQCRKCQKINDLTKSRFLSSIGRSHGTYATVDRVEVPVLVTAVCLKLQNSRSTWILETCLWTSKCYENKNATTIGLYGSNLKAVYLLEATSEPTWPGLQ